MCKEAVAAYIPHHNDICLEITGENHENIGFFGIQSSVQISPLGRKFEDLELYGGIIKNRLNNVFTYHSINYTGLYLQPTVVI
jgi:hypothetical protein